jgi:TPP-dependent 2-oxoacid decarboxylase
MAESIGGYLVRRLGEEGVDTVFGVPGDYVLGFFDLLEKSPPSPSCRSCSAATTIRRRSPD